MKDDDFKITEGSGNVFADIGLPNPEDRLKKAEQIFAEQQAKADFEFFDPIIPG